MGKTKLTVQSCLDSDDEEYVVMAKAVPIK